LKIAREFKDKFKLDKVLFIPNYVSPFKTDFEEIAPARHRLKMLELAIAGEPAFEIDDFEIRRDRVSYTIDTVKYLKEKYPEDELLLLIGSDQAADFDKWKDFDKILQNVLLVIANRKNGGKSAEISKYLKNSAFLNNELIEISSSEIRERIRKGQAIYEFVPFDVAEYIINNLLYI
jgi:nicotinate-nucleotide adenylyltransferase